MSLIGNVLKQLPKTVWMPWTAASAADAAMYKKMFRSGVAAWIISNEEINNIMEIVKSPEESGFLIKGVSETIQNEAKEPKSRFLSMFRVTLGVSLLGNLLTELKVKSINGVKELKGKKYLDK